MSVDVSIDGLLSGLGIGATILFLNPLALVAVMGVAIAALDMAKEIGISTSTFLRFCNKNGFDSFSEFKEAFKTENAKMNTRPPLEDLQELSLFFTRANSSAFEEKISYAVEIIKKTDFIIFIGMGSSGTLAKYGSNRTFRKQRNKRSD